LKVLVEKMGKYDNSFKYNNNYIEKIE
jgi:hypothetical protein